MAKYNSNYLHICQMIRKLDDRLESEISAIRDLLIEGTENKADLSCLFHINSKHKEMIFWLNELMRDKEFYDDI